MSSSPPIGVCIIIKNNKDQALLGKRLNSYKSGHYGFPGGRLELNETLENCAIRELKEETGLILKQLKYLGVVRESQLDHDFIHFVYLCDDFTGQPQLLEPEKCQGWEWFDVNELPPNTLPGHLAALKLINSKTHLIDQA